MKKIEIILRDLVKQKRLLMDVERKHFSIVATCKLDRFFRNLRLLLNHLHNLEQMGIKFVSTQ